MDSEAKLPEPMIDPQQVADAILEAAANHVRNKKVGMKATLNTATAKMFPRIADHMAAKQIDKLHNDEFPNRRDGALFQSSEAMNAAGQRNGLQVEA